jgi:catechol 2,3-dioxygenase-like lactoylglutathione lyase family enzyme
MNLRLRGQRALGRWIAGAAGALALFAAILGTILVESSAVAQTTESSHPPVRAVASVGITVSDLDRLTGFYTGTLGFEKVSETESAGDAVERLTGTFGVRRRTASLRIGDEIVELTQYLAPEARPIAADSRSNDRWFQHIAIVVADMDKAYAHLRAHNVRHASSGPQTLPDWNPDAGGISAFYFKDPDGHVLEAIHFPPGKGDRKWQRPADTLFLGIDHTAIVVADTERSLAFYRGVLGMRVAGASENYGTEQEHLNNVFGARLRITGLRAPQGPGIELLEYLAPTDGRDYPGDARACDLVSWTTNLVTPTAEDLTQRLRESHVRWISPGLVRGLDGAARLSAAAEVRDPDGHLLVIGQPTDRPGTARVGASEAR